MKLADLPKTPREEFDALSGKRPDVFLSSERGSLCVAWMRTDHDDFLSFHLIAVFGGRKQRLHFVFIGGVN